MTLDWDGKERRGDLPGRRFSDLATCPFHSEQHENIKQLWAKSDNSATKGDIKEVEITLRGKLDRWVFALFVTSITVIIILAGSLFGYVAVESIESGKSIAILQVNQQRLLDHFNIPAVESASVAKGIIEKEQDDE